MNAIAQAESLLVASAAMRTERPFARLPEHPLQGGFTDAAATQRGADRATAARLTYEARLERDPISTAPQRANEQTRSDLP